MRVVIASRIYLPEPAAASFRLDALARELVARGHDVTVVTARTPSRMGSYDEPGVRLRRVPVLRNRDGYVRGYLAYLSFDVQAFFRVLFGKRPGVIVAEPPPTTGFVTRVAAVLRRVPYVYYAADIWSDAAASIEVASLSVRILRRVEAGVFRRAARVLAVNEQVAERVRSLAAGAMVDVVGNGVDTAVFRPAGPTIEAPPYAIYAGTMSEWQGVDVFLRALPAVIAGRPGMRVVFLGQGTAREELQSLATELGVVEHVEFRDPVSAAEAATWIRGARLSLVSLRPGQGYDFALPTKVMASLACGTPVLFSGAQESPVRHLLASAPGDIAGRAVGANVDEVGVALAALMSGVADSGARTLLADWAQSEVSLDAVSARAAESITAASSDAR
jgi:glycosyltransferase involved in cell wall biosynthesis